MQEIYLDNSATTPLGKECLESIIALAKDVYGNPSSLHRLGIKAELAITEARNVLAAILGAHPSELYFTSGGTEANNLAIKGIAWRQRKKGCHIITTAVEHPSTLYACKTLESEGFRVDYLKVDKEGKISLAELEGMLSKETILVSIMHVNNEVGTIFPVEEIGSLIKRKNPGTLFHIDAVQSFCRLPIKPAAWQADLLSASAHKIGGPKGAGLLYKKKGLLIEPLFHGGGQEEGVRSGTENIYGIVGFGAAARKYSASGEENYRHMSALRDLFLAGVRGKIKSFKLNSPADGVPYIINISFPGIRGEVLLHYLEGKGIFVSTGSACHSRRRDLSHVLLAQGLTAAEIKSALRFSFSPRNTPAEIEYALAGLTAGIAELSGLY